MPTNRRPILRKPANLANDAVLDAYEAGDHAEVERLLGWMPWYPFFEDMPRDLSEPRPSDVDPETWEAACDIWRTFARALKDRRAAATLKGSMKD